jgi:hypothetical protein
MGSSGVARFQYVPVPGFARKALIFLALLASVVAAVFVVGLFGANDRIDRCADEGSDKYIADPIKRQIACK